MIRFLVELEVKIGNAGDKGRGRLLGDYFGPGTGDCGFGSVDLTEEIIRSPVSVLGVKHLMNLQAIREPVPFLQRWCGQT